MKTPHYLIECKCTDKKSFSVNLGLLEKVRREGAKEGRIGVIELEIQGTVCYVVPETIIELATQRLEEGAIH